MAQKPRIPKGTRDFSPEQVAKRNYIFNVIKSSFERFGFQPIETPSFELSETLLGKYGEEGDRLIFKILNSGDFLSDFNKIVLNFFFEFYKNYLNYYFLEDSSSLKFISISFDEKSILKTLRKINKGKIVDKIPNFIDDSLVEIIKIELILRIDSLKELCIKLNKDSEMSDFLIHEKAIDLSEIAFSKWVIGRRSKGISSFISEKALRYDLTVPFARYVAQHQNEIEFPFKRYQIQPVWRADRPQKGRFREFYQCDADVVGSKSLWQDVEFVQLYDDVFTALKLNGVTIKINNRKILSGIAEVIGAEDKLIDFTVALDKLDKIGEEKVKTEMLSKGIPQEGINKLQPLFDLSGSFESQISGLKTILSASEIGLKGVEELEFINNAISELQLQSATLQLDVTLARGLEYYTGAIFEVKAPKTVEIGSIGGGGRYDDLTGVFGLKDVSGVGISFGLDRIYLVLEALNLFPETVANNVDVLFINFGNTEALFSLKAIKILRNKGINAELFPDSSKMKKQMNYANKRNIPFVVLVGDNELKSNTYTLKNMNSGEQLKVSLEDLASQIK